MNMVVKTEGIGFDYKDKNWSLISIHTEPEENFLTLENKKFLSSIGMKESLSLCFWDISNNAQILEQYPHARLFSIEQAELVVGMISIANQQDDSTLILHCDAGISRSGAIGSFAADFLRLDMEKFRKDNPDIMPNHYVLSVLNKVSGNRPC